MLQRARAVGEELYGLRQGYLAEGSAHHFPLRNSLLGLLRVLQARVVREPPQLAALRAAERTLQQLNDDCSRGVAGVSSLAAGGGVGAGAGATGVLR